MQNEPVVSVTLELVRHHCEELLLDFLTEAAVAEYLDRRFPRASFSGDFARVLHDNTSGNLGKYTPEQNAEVGDSVNFTGSDRFLVSFELEYLLESRQKTDLLNIVHSISDMINVSYIRQKEALGLGHAVLRAMELVGDEPFSVVLADDVIEAETPCLKQLLDIHSFFCAPVLAGMEVPHENISAYGCIDGEPVHHNGSHDRVYRIRDLVEKPKPSEAPSNLAIIGRYVLMPEIFDSLQSINPGSGGEIQLTDALRHLLRSRPIYAYRFEGTRYDAGDKLGFLKATVEYALRRHDLGGPFREYLKGLKL